MKPGDVIPQWLLLGLGLACSLGSHPKALPGRAGSVRPRGPAVAPSASALLGLPRSASVTGWVFLGSSVS